MCAFLQRCSFNLPKDDSRATGAREVSVVAAVVDGLCPPRPRGLPSSGLSVLYGQRDDILPGLWDDAAHYHSSSSSPDRQSASISVPLSPLLGDSRSLNVTLPLANTLFQNGRRSRCWPAGGGPRVPAAPTSWLPWPRSRARPWCRLFGASRHTRVCQFRLFR